MPAPSWTAAEIETARTLWDKGHSAGDIAQRIPGKSRNAVIGIIHRKKWQRQFHTVVRKKPVRQTMTAARKIQLQERLEKARETRMQYVDSRKVEPLPPSHIWQTLPGTKPVAFLDLEPRHCRWPVDGGSCGCTKIAGTSYCETHAKLAFRSPDVRQKPAHIPSRIPALGAAKFDALKEMA